MAKLLINGADSWNQARNVLLGVEFWFLNILALIACMRTLLIRLNEMLRDGNEWR